MVLQLPVVPNFLGSSDLTENLPGYMYMARKQSLRIWAKSETKKFSPKKTPKRCATAAPGAAKALGMIRSNWKFVRVHVYG